MKTITNSPVSEASLLASVIRIKKHCEAIDGDCKKCPLNHRIRRCVVQIPFQPLYWSIAGTENRENGQNTKT